MGRVMDFGAHLREARERRGISLEEIAASTKISIRVLQALEKNDHARLPGGIFSRSFVRAYALHVGLDPERTVQQFLMQFPGSPDMADAEVPLNPSSSTGEDRGGGRGVRIAPLLLALAGVIVYFVATTRSPDSPVEERAPAPEVRAPVPAPAGGPAPEEATAEAPLLVDVATDGLIIEIAPGRVCWVVLSIDGERVFRGLMQPGDRETRRAREEIEIQIGDAGAFAYTINGVPGRPLGADGQVVNVRITPENYQSYLRL